MRSRLWGFDARTDGGTMVWLDAVIIVAVTAFPGEAIGLGRRGDLGRRQEAEVTRAARASGELLAIAARRLRRRPG